MKRYVVYYADGTACDCAADEAPPDVLGVQAILQDGHEEAGVERVCKCDLYVWDFDKERWKGVDFPGFVEWVLSSGLVMLGRTVSRQEFDTIMRRVGHDQHEWLAGQEP